MSEISYKTREGYNDNDIESLQKNRTDLLFLTATLHQFKYQVTQENIIDIWRDMREGGNSQDGKVKREVFKRIFSVRSATTKEALVDDIFDRIVYF